VALLPDQPPAAVQELALIDDQVSVLEPPDVIVPGLAVIDAATSSELDTPAAIRSELEALEQALSKATNTGETICREPESQDRVLRIFITVSIS
jgi:hypothetical protein